MKNQEAKWLLEEKYGGGESEAFHADLERLKAGEPLGYVIGHVPFLNCQIYLDNQPLIPRVETEYWVEKAIAAIKSAGVKVPHILDLCAGSGAIGVAIAKAVPEAFVDFGEIDERLLSTIQKNLKENTIINDSEKYQVIKSNLFKNVTGKYDYILSNPPYIDPKLDRTQNSVKKFEPHLALYGGEAGLDIIKKIIEEAPKYLKPSGQLWLEHEPEQCEAIKNGGKQAGFAVSTYQDQYDTLRYSVLKI